MVSQPSPRRVRSIVDRSLRKSLSLMKRVLVSHPTLRNALMDVSSTSEFTNLYEHEKMLADQDRMRAYERAIARYVKPGETVVDLGTGSGILALFAARNRPARIYAIDHSDFIEVAEAIARHNTDYAIDFVKVNSRHFEPAEKVDVIVHEQIGDELFEENMIQNLLDLRRRVLKEGGRIIPGRFELYMEPFAFKPAFRVPYIWEMRYGELDFNCLRDSALIERYKPASHRFRYIEPNAVDHLLCKPEPVLAFDLNDPTFDGRIAIGRQVKVVDRPGSMDGVCIYFKVIFDDEIRFDTSPLHSQGSNWGNRCFRTPERACDVGSTITFDVKMGSYLLPETWELMLGEAGEVVGDANGGKEARGVAGVTGG
ncbi:MAG: 50S ribosomal protein L11 methyltransferase [Phycisphaeraceae bacterium]